MSENMTYAGVGVDYDAMDPHKRDSQKAAAETDKFAERFGFSVVPWSRGESAFLVKTSWGYLGFVVEGLGTKSLVADALCHLAVDMESLTGRSFYDNVAQCNAAMAFNDLITLGASPVVYGQYLAVGDSDWFNKEKRRHDLVEGTKNACALAHCVWGGGETPTLKGIIVPGTADLAGATVGIITREDRLINPANIRHGDAIVVFESSGIHANGLTLAREIAGKLPDGYLTKLPDGRTYGETLLDPTYIYVDAIERCFAEGVDIHYAVNVTGHGWRKLMRASQPFSYVIEDMPWKPPIFDFIQKHGPVDDEEAFGNFNMGAGFVLYVPQTQIGRVFKAIEPLQYGQKREKYFLADAIGHIEKSDTKKVVIKPKGLEYLGSTLRVR